jgi:hypothetical protein
LSSRPGGRARSRRKEKGGKVIPVYRIHSFLFFFLQQSALFLLHSFASIFTAAEKYSVWKQTNGSSVRMTRDYSSRDRRDDGTTAAWNSNDNDKTNRTLLCNGLCLMENRNEANGLFLF